MKIIGERLQAQFGDAVDVKYIWNVMDFGYKGGDLLWMVEHGILTLAYQSTSYLADRVPELDLADLPFLFEGVDQARAAMDGELGAYLTRKIEERIPAYRVVGYFENGYRHISNRLHPVRTPEDIKGMRVRLMPGRMHEQSFAQLGAIPCPLDLKPGLEAIVSGAVDAQENPMANTVDYGAHKAHRYHTLTGHCYLSRGIYVNRSQYDSWPAELQNALRAAAREAVDAQRKLAVAEEDAARRVIEEAGGEVIELSSAQRAAFAAKVRTLHDLARSRFAEADRLLPRR
jgi:TRAP-type C4-dicarboxylate transport system substrate-binding protein